MATRQRGSQTTLAVALEPALKGGKIHPIKSRYLGLAAVAGLVGRNSTRPNVRSCDSHDIRIRAHLSHVNIKML